MSILLRRIILVGALMFVSVCTDTLRGCLIVVLQSV
jgi:hypothetical protein